MQKCFAQKLSCILPINRFFRFSAIPALYELGCYPQRDFASLNPPPSPEGASGQRLRVILALHSHKHSVYALLLHQGRVRKPRPEVNRKKRMRIPGVAFTLKRIWMPCSLWESSHSDDHAALHITASCLMAQHLSDRNTGDVYATHHFVVSTARTVFGVPLLVRNDLTMDDQPVLRIGAFQVLEDVLTIVDMCTSV